MTDDEARAAAWAQHEHRFTAEGAEAYALGWYDALAHARRWRPLTSDPKTWPEEGQSVLMHTPHGGEDYRICAWSGDGYKDVEYLYLQASWLPLPPPSEEDGR